MAFDKLNFSKNWENAEDFPTFEQDESQVRKDMQVLHDETKAYLNDTLLPQMDQELDGKANDNNVLHKDEIEEYTPSQDYHPVNVKYLNDRLTDLSQGNVPDGSVTYIKMAPNFWEHVYEKEEVYNKDETYSKDEVYNKEETYSKEEVYNKEETDSLLSETNETVATKASKEEAQLVGYEGQLFRLVPDLSNPWLDLSGCSQTVSATIKSNLYKAVLTINDQKFYSLETGELVSECAVSLDSDYSWLAEPTTDDAIFVVKQNGNVCRTYLFNAETGLYYTHTCVYDGYYRENYYLGSKDGYGYIACRYTTTSDQIVAVNLSTMQQDTSKTAYYSVTDGSTLAYRNCCIYELTLSSNNLMLTIVDVAAKSTQVKSIASGVSAHNGIAWVDEEKNEVWFYVWNGDDYIYRLASYNLSTGEYKTYGEDGRNYLYWGHLNDETYLRAYMKEETDDIYGYAYLLEKVIADTDEVIASCSVPTYYLKGRGVWDTKSKNCIPNGKYFALGQKLFNTETLEMFTLQGKTSYLASSYTGLYTLLTPWGIVYGTSELNGLYLAGSTYGETQFHDKSRYTLAYMIDEEG